MAEVRRLFPTVGLPSPTTKAPQRYDSSVPEGISRLAQTAGGVVQTFAQKYDQAQYADGMAQAQLEIMKAVNAYHEDRRQNPIQLSDGDGETIVELKEKAWNTFSDKLASDYIGNLPHRRVRETVLEAWGTQREKIRSDIADGAITEEISRMASNSANSVQELAQLGDYSSARNLISQGGATGLFSEAAQEDLSEYIDLQEVIGGADFEPVPGSLNVEKFAESALMVESSNLPERDKAKAQNYFEEKAEQWANKEKERIEIEERQSYNGALDLIYTGQIYSEGQFHEILKQGTTEAFREKKEAQLMAIWRATQNDKDGTGSTSAQDKASINVLDSLVLQNKPREEVIATGYGLMAGGTLSSTAFRGWEKKLGDTFGYEDLSHDLYMDWLDAHDDLAQTDKNRLASEVLRLYTTASEGRIITGQEIPIEDMTKLLNNFGAEVQTKNLGALKGFFTEAGGEETFTIEEATSSWLLAGGGLGAISTSALPKFFNTPNMPVDVFRENLAMQEYGVPFKSLDNRQKSHIKATSDVAVLGRATQAEFAKEYGIPSGVLAIGREGHPVIQVTNPSGEVGTYRLQYDAATNEEQWFKWGTVDGGATIGWHPDIAHRREAAPADPGVITQGFQIAERIIEGRVTAPRGIEGTQTVSQMVGQYEDETREDLSSAERTEMEAYISTIVTREDLTGVPPALKAIIKQQYPEARNW